MPEKCCQIVPFSQMYKEPFVCNFLGLSASAEIPKHLFSSDMHIVVDILPSGSGAQKPARLKDSIAEPESRLRERESPPTGYRLAVHGSSRNGDTKCEIILSAAI